MNSNHKIDQTIERYFAAVQDLDVKGWLTNFVENAELTDPVGSPTLRGHAAIGEHFQQITAVFSKIDLRAAKSFPCGNQVAVLFNGTGVGKNGVSVEFEGIDVMELNDAGKIIRLSGFWNPGPAIAKASK